jgi:hypothetical protein
MLNENLSDNLSDFEVAEDDEELAENELIIEEDDETDN